MIENIIPYGLLVGFITLLVGVKVSNKGLQDNKVSHKDCSQRRQRVSDEIVKISETVNKHTEILGRLDERSEYMKKTLDKMNGG